MYLVKGRENTARGARKRVQHSLGEAGEKSVDVRRAVERVQTGVRMERRVLNVLKALADLHAITLGDLLEGIVLHAFEGKAPFSEQSLEKIQSLKGVFGLDLGAADSHLLVERAGVRRRRPHAEESS
jgi:hypothetical protein